MHADIIALLILGVLLIGVYLLWQGYLENVQLQAANDPNATRSWMTPPPLMKLSLWRRAKGRFAVMMCIAFLTWCSFLSWTFWAQVRGSFSSASLDYYLSICYRPTRSCTTRVTSAIRPCAPSCASFPCLSPESSAIWSSQPSSLTFLSFTSLVSSFPFLSSFQLNQISRSDRNVVLVGRVPSICGDPPKRGVLGFRFPRRDHSCRRR